MERADCLDKRGCDVVACAEVTWDRAQDDLWHRRTSVRWNGNKTRYGFRVGVPAWLVEAWPQHRAAGVVPELGTTPVPFSCDAQPR